MFESGREYEKNRKMFRFSFVSKKLKTCKKRKKNGMNRERRKI